MAPENQGEEQTGSGAMSSSGDVGERALPVVNTFSETVVPEMTL